MGLDAVLPATRPAGGTSKRQSHGALASFSSWGREDQRCFTQDAKASNQRGKGSLIALTLALWGPPSSAVRTWYAAFPLDTPLSVTTPAAFGHLNSS